MQPAKIVYTANSVGSNIDRKTLFICLAIILLALLVATVRKFQEPDPVSQLAISLYTEILRQNTIVGVSFSPITTTLGYYPAKRVQEDPVAAALMVRLLKDAGASSDSVIAINVSGSFPGFTLAALAACAAMGLETYVIASVGSSSFGANVLGNTIVDMLLQDSVRALGHTLLAVTPGGSNDQGSELYEKELRRIQNMLIAHGIPFIQPFDLTDAIVLRESLFSNVGSTLLINIGGNHASFGAGEELAFLSGILNPNEIHATEESGLIQFFLRNGLSVIQILNVRRLYAAYGLEFDQTGRLLGNRLVRQLVN